MGVKDQTLPCQKRYVITQCKSLFFALVLLSLATFNLQLSTLFAQGTAFTYQGRLNSGGVPANGSYDIAFTLYATNVTGSIFAGPVTNTAVNVTNGLFTTTVDFGSVFTSASNWLELAVSTNRANSFTALIQCQQLTPVPYALYSANAMTAVSAASASTVAAANISGTLTTAQLPASVLTNGASGVNISGAFSGNGAGMTNVDLLRVNNHGSISWTTNSGLFVLAASPSVGSGPQSVAAADVNGDGLVDLISANSSTNTLTVLTNNGSGGFVVASTLS